MKAVQFRIKYPRPLMGVARDVGSVVARFFPGVLWSGLVATQIADVSEPRLPADDWVKIKTRYGGICGSDLSVIHLRGSPYGTALISFPFTFGHENVGRIAEVGPAVRDWSVGERVVVEPTLWCKPRGFDKLCRYCARGEINLCERNTDGKLGPGFIIGYCRDTGGSWSQYFVAHESQLYRVPDTLSDENALLVEPFAAALHAALHNYPHDDETVLIFGAGVLGLLTLAALRTLGSKAQIIVLARHPFQADAARKLGAAEIIDARRDYYAEIATRTAGQLHKPLIGKRVMVGGVDCTFECVGTDTSVDDALRMTRSGGHVVLVGVLGATKNVDWSSVFFKELDVRSSHTYHHAETFCGRKWKTFDLTLDLMQRGHLDLGWLVTHKFRLDDYAHAFQLLNRRGASKAIKAVFEFDE